MKPSNFWNREVIRVENLSYSYHGSEKAAVQEVSFTVNPGEVFGFLGPSGAGKSTTQKILIRLLKNYSGFISIFSRNLPDWDSTFYERIGVSFEFPNHFLKLTGLENLKYFGSLYSHQTESPETLLEILGLTEDRNVRVSQYSKGMKNRLSIARALLHRPELIFLDEPTSGLDPVNARHIKDLILEKKAEGRTVFMTTHDMVIADQLCDQVAFMIEGRIQTIDSPRELKQRYGKKRVRVEHVENGALKSQEFDLEDLADNPSFLNILRQNQVQTIHTLEGTLEDIFLRLTGRSLQSIA